MTVLLLLSSIYHSNFGTSVLFVGEKAFIEAQRRLFDFEMHKCFIEGIAQSSPYQTNLVMTAFELGIEFLKGGNLKDAQMAIVNYFLKKPESQFFDKVRSYLKLCTERVATKRQLQARQTAATDSGTVLHLSESELEILNSDQIYKEMMLPLRFLQLLTEGHNNLTQKMIGNQEHAQLSVDLTAEVVLLLEEVARDISNDTMELVLQIFGTLTEFIQGPCSANQTLMAKTSLIMVSTTILVAHLDLDILNLHILRNAILINLTSMLERRDDKAIHLQIQSTLEPKSLRMLLIECFEYLKIADDVTDDIIKEEAANIYSLTGLMTVQCPIFMVNLDPERLPEAEKVTYVVALKKIKETMGHVEIFWNGKLERIFFAIPDMCAGFTSTRRKEVLWGLQRDSPESKLSDFLEWSDVVYIYLNHEEKLRQFQIYSLVSQFEPWILQARLVLSLLINALILATLSTPNGGALLDHEPLYEWESLTDDYLSFVLFIMACGNAFLALLLCFVTYANRGYLEMLREKRKMKKENGGDLKCWQKLVSPFFMLLQWESFETLLYLAFSLLGIFG